MARLSPLTFLGFAIASIGGPIALVSFFPGAAGEGTASAGLVVVLSLALFAAPLAVWWLWSDRVVSPGGLSAFVADAAGRRVALAQGWIWAFAYFLYLPYTVTFVVYDLLAPVFPGITAYRAALELALPVAIVLIVLAPVAAVLIGIAALAVAQLAGMLALAGIEYAHVSTRIAQTPGPGAVARGAGNTALLFVCASLPLYLGAEVRGGSRTVRPALVAAVGIVGGVFLLAAVPLSRVPQRLLDAPVPGSAIAQAYAGRDFAVVVGLLTAASTLALIVAEYLALGRLLNWLHGAPLRTTLSWIAIPFLAADAISLINPNRFYDTLLKPSLIALFVSQLIVFVAFPRVRRTASAIAISAVASALAAWGLYTLLVGGAST